MPRVVYFEIHGKEPQKSIAFFSRVFGWDASRWPGDEEYYNITTGPKTEEGINGGLMKSKDDQPRTVNVIDVDSVDKYGEIIERNGGKVVVPKFPITGIGYALYFTDPNGILMGIYHPDKSAK